jgi:type IX secretion system PorP/SprF family membrane protein
MARIKKYRTKEFLRVLMPEKFWNHLKKMEEAGILKKCQENGGWDMKKHILIVFLIMLTGTAHGQQQPVQSLYMFDQTLLNPAYTGMHVQMSATFINRNQWVNFPGAPVTQTFSLHSSFFDARVGGGMIFTRDKIGIHQDYGVFFNYAYHLPVSRKGKLSMGLQGGFNHLSSDYNMLTIRDLTDPNLQGRLTKMNPNFGAGLFYYTGDFFAGFSVPYLLENNIVDVEGVLSEAKQSRNYYVHGGYTFRPNPNLMIKPFALMRMVEGSPFGWDANMTVVYKEIISLGTSYRSNDALVFLFELMLVQNLHMGYAYDYTLSEIRQYSNGSHELMLNYRFKIPRIHKSIPCPSYF